MTVLSSSSFATNVAVIGSGSWGTALAASLASKLDRVTLWCLEAEVAEEINRSGRNPLYVSEFDLPKAIQAETDLLNVVANNRVLVMVVPTQFTRQVLNSMLEAVTEETIFVFASKGVEVETLTMISEIYAEVFGQERMGKACFLSGPSFAREVLQGQPTAVAIAGENEEVVQEMQALFYNSNFRTYRSQDVIGVELGGALKNIIALAAGISDGLGFGHNARAALITRGLAEIIRLGVKMGAMAETFSGLSGLGDLLLTATSTKSRNYTVGFRLGKGETLGEIQKGAREVSEGVKTTLSVQRLARKVGVDMPITQAVYEILYEAQEPGSVVERLMERDLKPE